jgi:hypothetical protein
MLSFRNGCIETGTVFQNFSGAKNDETTAQGYASYHEIQTFTRINQRL